MVVVRARLASRCGMVLGMALTIAIRYSAIRRQGELRPGFAVDSDDVAYSGPETKVLDYQTQQYRLLPHLARSYAMMFAGQMSVKLGDRILQEAKEGKYDGIPHLHATTAGLKSLCSWDALNGVEQCRQACGGHGYSLASNISVLYGVSSTVVTYEGENIVLMLQVGRYLMKAAATARASKKSAPLTAYLVKEGTAKSSIGADVTVPALIEALEIAAKSRVFKAFDRLEEGKKSTDEHTAWNRNTVEINKASRAHSRLFIANAFVAKVKEAQDFRIREVLEDLLKLYLAYEVTQSAKYLLEEGVLNGQQLRAVKELLYTQLARVRPNAVSLVDAYDFEDFELRSVLGRRDGHVYENLLKFAQDCPLNKHEVLPAFGKYLRPILDKAQERCKI